MNSGDGFAAPTFTRLIGQVATTARSSTKASGMRFLVCVQDRDRVASCTRTPQCIPLTETSFVAILWIDFLGSSAVERVAVNH